jgi:DNA-binding XRE family transcriptional regulator
MEKKRSKDFLEEIIEESSLEEPRFRQMVEVAVGARKLLRQLAKEREGLGLTQAEVARRMATSQPAVARIEAGEVDAKLSTVDRYAAALGKKVEWRLVRLRGSGQPI